MATPALVKTWQFAVNTVIAASGSNSTTNRNAFFGIKQALAGFASNPWIVVASSSGAGAAGASDLWVTSANIIGASAGSNHSWIQLRQAGIASNFELLLDCNAISTANWTILVSPAAGFIGGTAIARPTATDEIALVSGSLWGGLNGSPDNNVILHVMQSTDWQCTRVITCSQNICSGFWIFDKPASPVSGWTNPSISYVAAGNESVVLATSVICGSAANLRGRGTATMNVFCAVEGQNFAALPVVLTSLNDFDSSIPFLPLSVGSVTAGHRGRHGSLFDMWLGLITPGVTGDTFPASGTRVFALFSDAIFPWNGTIPVIS